MVKQTLSHFFCSLCCISSLSAANITVTTAMDSGAGSLREALFTVMTTGDAANTITFDPGLTITLTAPLPPVYLANTSDTLSITGNSTIIDGDSTYRGLFIQRGVVTLDTFTLQNVLAQAGNGGNVTTGTGSGSGGGGGLGAGGALFIGNEASVTATNITIPHDSMTLSPSATGGNGGSVFASTTNLPSGGGGGGGIGGDGGDGASSAQFSGGGGGGYYGDGGSCLRSAGGGGGMFGNGGGAATTFQPGSGGGGVEIGSDGSNATVTDGGAGGDGFGAMGGGAGGALDTDGGAGSAYPVGGGGGGGGNHSAGAGNAGSGGNGGFGSGGGGGGANAAGGALGIGGSGGDGGIFGGGGSGGTSVATLGSGAGGVGGEYGGGGGSAGNNSVDVPPGAAGGFGGGGSGAGSSGTMNDGAIGGAGGFGAGGGGGSRLRTAGTKAGGAAGLGGGTGGTGTLNQAGGGGGGGALGGAVFVRDGGSLTIDSNLPIGFLTAGSAGTAGTGSAGSNGETFGTSLFINGNSTVIFNPTGTLTISGTIADDQSLTQGSGTKGNGAIQKIQTGTLSLEGANTYTGGTTLSAGTISIAHNTALGTGTLSMSNNTTLAIGSGVTAANSITTSSNTVTMSVASGTGSLTGTITGSGTINSTGGATLSLVGNNLTSFTGTIANDTTLIFNQTANSTYSGNISSTGTFSKQGSANLTYTGDFAQTTATIDAGTLFVNTNNFTLTTLTVGASGVLGGNGTITGNVINQGEVSPGNSIDTLNIVGDYTQASGSTLTIELNPSATDLVSATGAIVIQDGATIAVIPEEGTYANNSSFIVLSGASLTGTFSTITSSLPTFNFTQVYSDTTLTLTLGLGSFAALGLSPQANAVAKCIDIASPPSTSDLSAIIASLRLMSTEELNKTLSSMSPAIFNNLDLAQEETLTTLNEIISFQMRTRSACEAPSSFQAAGWGKYFSAVIKQDTDRDLPGYSIVPFGIVAGVDFSWNDEAMLGICGGYTEGNAHFKLRKGSSLIQSGYGSVYANKMIDSIFYINGALTGSVNFYDTKRLISFASGQFTSFTREAKSDSKGVQASILFEAGAIASENVRALIRANYLITHRNAFEEHGANSIDLVVSSHNADLLRSEINIELKQCLDFPKLSFIPSVLFGAGYENRFFGRTETAKLYALTCPIEVDGQFPNQAFFLLECAFTIKAIKDQLALVGKIENEWGYNMSNFNWMTEMKVSF